MNSNNGRLNINNDKYICPVIIENLQNLLYTSSVGRSPKAPVDYLS
jgi:hypothetical protein